MKISKTFIKVIAMAMTILLVFQIIPSTVIWGAAKDIESAKRIAEAKPITESQPEPAEIMQDTEKKQNAHTKTFTRKDGTMVDIISTEPVHYYKDGEWKDIDNTLVNRTVDGKEVLQNKSNDFTATLPQTLDNDSYISIDNGENKVSFKLNGVSTQKDSRVLDLNESLLSKEDTMMSINDNVSTVRYNDVLGTADVEYLVTETGIKENIIIDTAPSKGYFISFTFTAPGMTWNLNKDNSISFFNEKLEEVFKMQAPYMFDNAGSSSEDINVEVYRSKEGNIIKYTPSFEWISDKTRVYPITIDPTLTTFNRAALVNTTAGTYSGSIGEYMYVQNYEANGNIYNSAMLLDLQDSLLSDEVLITSATVKLRCEPLSTGGDFSNIIGISLANESWNTQTTTIPQSSSDYLDVHAITSAASYEFDVTEAFNMWSMGLCNKFGFVIKSITDGDKSCNVKIGGEDGNSHYRPCFTVNYKHVYGLKDDFEYHSIDMGRAGTVYVNDVTNALVVVREEIGLAGNIMPANLSRIYDSKLNNASEYALPQGNGAGTNWQWNYYGRLVYTTGAHRYYGGDGTWLYFYLAETLEDGTQKYSSPDSDKLTLWIEADATSLSDYLNMYFEDDEYTYRFNSVGKVISITQKSNQKSIGIEYSAYSTIGKIIDGVGREFRLAVEIPANSPRKTNTIGAYTSSGERITVDTPDSETPTNIEMTYTYDTSVADVTLFKSATYADGETVRYEYNDANDLVLIENIDGSKLEIEYINGRVSSYTKWVYDTITEQYLFDERVEFSMISPYEHVFTTYDGDESTPVYTETVYYNEDFDIERRLDSEGNGSSEYYYSDGELKASVNTEEGTNLLTSQALTNATVVSNTKLVSYNSRPIEGATGEQVYKIDYSPLELSRAYKQIDVRSFTTEEYEVTFNAELWVKSPNAAHLHGHRKSAIMMEAIDAEAEVSVTAVYPIDTSITSWQYIPCCITVPSGTEYVNFYILNDYQVSPLYYADVTFYKTYGSVYYAEDFDFGLNSEDTELTTCVCGTECEYGEGCPCICTSAEECTCVCCHATSATEHDEVGNILLSTNSDGSTCISETYTYSADQNFLASASDSLGNTVEYGYNTSNGTLSSFTEAKDNTINYKYNAMLELAEVSQAVSGVGLDGEVDIISKTVEYSKDRLTSIATANNVNYSFSYDAFGNQKDVKVGNQELSSHIYGIGENNDKIASVTYGNGQVVRYSYDTEGNITAIDNDSLHSGYEYVYSYHNGTLASVLDRKNGLMTTFGIGSYTITDLSNDLIYQAYYDEDNNFVETVNGYTFTYEFSDNDSYNPSTGKNISSFSVGNSSVSLAQTDTVDYYGRKEQKEIGFEGWTDDQKVKTTYEYSSNGSNTSEQISRIATTYKCPDGKKGTFSWDYTYDKNGNIISENILTDMGYFQDYDYDEAGQLTWAYGWVYMAYAEYDNGGNVVCKELAADTYGIYEWLEFEYGDANWPDKLTAVNGLPITYDAIGNPLSYNGTTYTWTAGRELATMTSADKSLSFKYNDSGLRTHKIVTKNGTSTNYTYSWSEDGKLVSQSDGTTTLYFIYDTNDEVIGFVKLTDDSSELFYYVKNLQGDVCAIIDSSGVPVVYYKYDAWGYLIQTLGTHASTIGILNPIRYRSYYYDTETGYYYLQSRYYDPLWGRFINADNIYDFGLFCNLFTYCSNSPVVYKDQTGMYNMTPELCLEHYNYNKKFKVNGYFVNGQARGNVGKMKYGLLKMKDNGCELIAIYNALLHFGKGMDLAKIIYDFERDPNGIWFDGIFGTHPESIYFYLRNKGLKPKMYFSTKSLDETIEKNKVYIFSFFHTGLIIHTVMARVNSSGKLSVFNLTNGTNKTAPFTSFAALLSNEKGRIYMGYLISK